MEALQKKDATIILILKVIVASFVHLGMNAIISIFFLLN